MILLLLLLYHADHQFLVNPVLHAGVKGVSERSELTPCIII